MERMNKDEASIYRLLDVVAEKFTPCIEYPNDRVAHYACDSLKLPPYTQSGDYECWKIADRVGNEVKSIDPVKVWVYEAKHEAPI